MSEREQKAKKSRNGQPEPGHGAAAEGSARPELETGQTAAASSPRQDENQAAGNENRTRELEAKVEELGAANSSLQDELLRKAAEFENFRKRMFRDKEEAIKYANAGLLNDVLPIIDDFERAIQSAGESEEFAAFHAGVSLIEKQLVSVLERNWGLKRFSAEGQSFDPERHEAVAAEESEQHAKPIVLEEYQKGYFLHDRVLRPAKVKVAKPVTPAGSGGNSEPERNKE